MQLLCFASIVEFIAACPLCLHGSAVKIALCHAPLLRFFILVSKSPQISQNPRQAEKGHFTTNTISTMTKTMVHVDLLQEYYMLLRRETSKLHFLTSMRRLKVMILSTVLKPSSV